MTIPLRPFGAEGPASLSPAQWFDADLGIVLGSGVQIATWQDQSGHGRDATQVTAGSRPTIKAGGLNSHATVTFTGAQFLTHDLTLPSPCTLFAVAKTSVTTDYATIATWSSVGVSGQFLFACSPGVNNWGIYANANADAGSSLNAFKVCTAVVRAANDIDFRTNGVSVHVTTGVSDYNAASQIGAGGAGGFQDLLGEIATLIAFDRVLSVADCIEIETALRGKYGL